MFSVGEALTRIIRAKGFNSYNQAKEYVDSLAKKEGYIFIIYRG